MIQQSHARAAVLSILVVLVAVAVAPGVVAAQDTVNETVGDVAGEEDASVMFDFSNGAELRDVSFTEREGPGYTAEITVVGGDERSQAFVSEPIEDQGEFSFRNFVLPAGEERSLQVPVTERKVGVAVGDTGILVDDQGVTVLQSSPTVGLLQLGVGSGVWGTINALMLTVLKLRRDHHNNYEELFSEKRFEIEDDPVETTKGWVAKQWRATKSSRVRIAAAALIGVYVVAVLFTGVRSPSELWSDASDAQRLWMVAVTAATLLALAPVYLLVKRYLWNPDTSFVLDLDSKDVYKAANGDKSGGVAAYSGPPDRISDLDVDGSMTSMSTPGGTCHLVRGFDPGENTAEGNPPELHDDREASLEATKIEQNRQTLTDLALIGKDLIGAMSSFRVVADTNAVQGIDANIRHALSAGGDSMEDVLQQAVEGTRYEGTYQPASGGSDGEESGSEGSDPQGDGSQNASTGEELSSDSAGDGSGGGSEQ